MENQKYRGRDWLGDILLGMASGASGRQMVPKFQAQAAGIPEGAGTSPAQFQALMGQRAGGGKLAEQKELIDYRDKKGRAKAASQFTQQEDLEVRRATRALENKKAFEKFTRRTGGSKDPKQQFMFSILGGIVRDPNFKWDALDIKDLLKRTAKMYETYQETTLPGATGTPKTQIRVKLKKDGTTGLVDPEDFDPKTMVKING